MKKYIIRALKICLIISCFYLSNLYNPFLAFAEVPAVDEMIDFRKISITEAFQQLKKIEKVVNENKLNEQITTAFLGREKEAINHAINLIRSPKIGYVNGELVNRMNDFRIAKKIFIKYSTQAMNHIEKEYYSADPILRGNIVEMLGTFKNDKKAVQILIESLNDTSISDEESPEIDGYPMRVCDNAYNQLVLIYEVQGVLRTIGPMYNNEIRDYHIGILKNKLSVNN